MTPTTATRPLGEGNILQRRLAAVRRRLRLVATVEGARRVPGMVEVCGIEVEYSHNYFVGSGDNALLVHNGPEKVARPLQSARELSLSPSGARSASPAFGEDELRALAGDINKSKDA